MSSPKNIKKRSVQDMAIHDNGLLKAITPWTGNVILPAQRNENTFCEGTDPCFTSDKTSKFCGTAAIFEQPHISDS